MHNHSRLVPALLALSPLALPGVSYAQDPAKPAPAAAAAPAADLQGLPTFLLPVPGGKVKIGMAADKLIEAACQTVNPHRPAEAAKAPDKVGRALKNTVSELGSIEAEVEPFLLGKWTVTNEEYEVYVKQMRANGIEVRAPYHWWRYGAKEDFEAKLGEIAKEFPKEPQGALFYWERNGTKLPYKLLDENGKPIGKLPVVFVSYREAMRFAGWLGMRLPTETEWTRAARGDSSNVWLWGSNKEIGDKYVEKVLALLKLENMRDKVLKPVGEVQFATGPFGHFDMVGQVWELTSDLGYAALTGDKSFKDEWKKLTGDKLGALVQNPPLWKPELVVAKGGSYLSNGNPIELHIDARVPLQTIDVVQSAGIRLAKTLRPGYDALFALLRGVYNTSIYLDEQTIDLDRQIGAEKYTLGADGFPTGYQTVSFAPTNWMSRTKGQTLDKLIEHSHHTPLVVGMIALTEKSVAPELPPGQYTVLWHPAGMPKELSDAIKAGHKDVQAALKAKARSDEPAAEEPKKDDKKDDAKGDKDKQDKNKKGSWRDVLTRYGLTEQDLEPKDAVEKLAIMRIKGAAKDNQIVVPTDKNHFLFFDSEGRMAGLIDAGTQKPVLGNPVASTLVLGPHQHQGKEVTKADLHFSTPANSAVLNKHVEFKLHLLLECTPPSATNPWRMPPAPAAAGSSQNVTPKGK